MRFALVPLVCLLGVAAVGAQQVYTPGDGVSLPVVVSEVKPEYTQPALEAGIEGEVQMSVVVQGDGTVGEVRVTKSLDSELGLDRQAVEATRQWRFEPGRREGKPVAVRVTISMWFTLK